MAVVLFIAALAAPSIALRTPDIKKAYRLFVKEPQLRYLCVTWALCFAGIFIPVFHVPLFATDEVHTCSMYVICNPWCVMQKKILGKFGAPRMCFDHVVVFSY